MFNAAARDSRDKSGKMLLAKHSVCNIRHKATLRQMHRCQQQLLIHKQKSMLAHYNVFHNNFCEKILLENDVHI